MKNLRTTNSKPFPDSTPIEILSRTGRWYFDSSRLNLDHINARAAFDSAPVALALCDLAGDVLCANRLFITWLGLGSQTFLTGKNLAQVCHLPDLYAFMDRLPGTTEVCDMEMILASNTPSHQPQRVLWKGQRIAGADLLPRWLVLSLTPLPDRNEPAQCITESLAEAQKVSGIAHWCLPCQPDADPGSMDMFWSCGAQHWLGMQGVHACGDWLARMVPEDRLRMQQCLTALIVHGTPYRMDYQLLDRQGVAGCWVHSRGSRMAHADAAGYMLIGTEQVHEADAAGDEEWSQMVNWGRSLFGTSDWPVCMLDKAMRVQYSNHVFQSYLCRHQDDDTATGLPLQQLIHDVTVRRQLTANVRHALRGQRRAEVIRVSSDGVVREFDINLLPLRSATQELLGVLLIGVMTQQSRPAP